LSFFPRAVSSSPTTPPSSFEDWKTLVRGFFDALIADARFGKDAIRSWWFEVWNEPNIERFWLGNFGQYLDLYRATSEAVLEGGYDVRLGGPAIAYLPDRPDGPTPGEQLMKDFLTFLSENPQVKCDFLSLHRKGSFLPPDAAESDEPGIDRPISAAEETAQLALQIDPERFRGVTVVNNEADIKVGFDVPFEPRMTEAFPAWLTGLAIAYDALSSEFAEHDIRFMAASDDANLQPVMNTFDGRRSIMTRASSSLGDLFKVPVFNFYELLKLLGDRHGTFITGANSTTQTPSSSTPSPPLILT
jgi:Glycosyl hydrolases family 39